MLTNGLGTTWSAVALVAVVTASIYLTLVAFSRLAGLRSFAEMTNFDAAATVMIGSIVATTAVSTRTSLLTGVVAVAVVFAMQWLLAQLRQRFRAPEVIVDGGPLLLMNGGRVIVEHLAVAQVTRNDLRAKLRQAGVTRYDQVSAVVMEVTGVVSVLVKEPDDPPMDPELFASVRGREQLFPEHQFAD